MNIIIYPRSPRETMAGWIHLPRYIDKIRLHLAGKLHLDYQPNFGKGFDGMWLNAAGGLALVPSHHGTHQTKECIAKEERILKEHLAKSKR